ncbi:GNAT family N-acetyltransferase [Actinomadura adrarensis]|uniref:Lysine N-acyltransferase MbtK n=1 Tax=Actinomadura adrarensis TaxID=1819600 RepID=A0ABW3CLY1_9ACTN
MKITWRRVVEDDFPLLREWLQQPHVARWWNHETSPEAVARDFGASARGEEPSEDFLALLDERPIGLMQRCKMADYPEYQDELGPVAEVPAGAVSIDYLIGDPGLTGRGVGPEMIRSILDRTWTDFPDATCVIVPVSAHNRASWRALEKAGFKRIAVGEMEPDNPIDDRLHYVYRIDRP